MVHAYNYRLRYSDDCCWIYLNQVLLGTIDKGVGNTWHVNITITGDSFLFTKFGLLRPSIYIQDINSGLNIANINTPLFPFFRKFSFVDKGGKKIYWIGKNFLSFHWVWKLNDKLVVEAFEDIVMGNNTGVITLSAYLNESNLLIITGIFLSLRVKRKRSLGLLDKHKRFFKKDKMVSVSDEYFI